MNTVAAELDARLETAVNKAVTPLHQEAAHKDGQIRNPTTTLLTANAHKDDEGVKHDNILTRFFGIVSHDHESKFYNYGTKHAACGGHLNRELKGMNVLCMLPWAGQARAFFLEMNGHKSKLPPAKAGGLAHKYVVQLIFY